jgi:hypothetical protein
MTKLSLRSNVRSRAMAFIAGTAIVGATVVFMPTTASAQSCDRNTNVHSRCGQEFRSGFENTLRYSGYDNYRAARRAQSVGEAVKNCYNCAIDSVKDAFRNFNGSSGSSRGSGATR